MCLVASQTGQKVKEEKVHNYIPCDHEIGTKADCLAAAKVLGLKVDHMHTNYTYGPSGCSWYNYDGEDNLVFNTNPSSIGSYGERYCGKDTKDNYNFICLCVQPCPIGNYQNEESSKTCKSCLAGTYNDETGQALCKSCLAGHYQPGAGKTNCDDKCVAGAYSTEETGASSCTKCLQGTASTTIGASTNSTCIKCIGGQYSTSAGASSCSSCLKGTYSAEVGQSSPDICKSCQAGTYNNETTGQPSCKSCPSGWYQQNKASIACNSCTFGQYTPSSTDNQCTVCASGFYQANEIATTWKCLGCGLGMFTPDDRTPCAACIAGTYQPKKEVNEFSSNGVCLPCTPGQWTNQSSSSKCRTCSVGTYSPSTKKPCDPCDAGTYQPKSVLVISGIEACQSCPAKTYTDKTGRSSCIHCPTGKESNAAHDECEDTETNKLIIPLVVGLGIIVAILIEVGVAAICRSCKIKQKHEVEIGISLLENAHNPLEEDEEEGDGEDETFESSIA